jgi:2-dehydropantoate 2-reductase
LLGLRNGGFPAAARSGPFRRRVAALAEEASRALELRAGAAAAEGAGALLERAESVAAATAANTNSMLADLRAGRASEAPFIGGAVVRALAAAGERAPASEAALAAISAREAALGVAPLEAAALARVLARSASARARAREGQ